MRLAYVCADLGVPVFGRKGCSIHVQEVVRALLAAGVDVELFTTRPEGNRPHGLEKLRVYSLRTPPKGEPGAREQAALQANGDTIVALHQAGPFDAVYERYSLWNHAGMDYARTQRIPGLLEINAPLIEEQREHRRLMDESAARHVAERVFDTASALIAVSDGVATYVSGFPNTESRLHVIPNGVDPIRFAPGVPPTFPRGDDTFTVGFVGTLKPWHGVTTLVEALGLLRRTAPEARLLIVGDGPERSHLEDNIAARGLVPFVHFTGAVESNAIPGMVTSMDVAVAPYPLLEHFYFSPLKVYEYMAAGRAVVASRIGQLADLIEHGVHGLLYPPGDAVVLTAALQCLRQDPALRERLGRAARSRVVRRHTWDSVARRILDLAGLAVNDPDGTQIREGALR
jgi:glycosyltransferase involved in cell wall biosynthesis